MTAQTLYLVAIVCMFAIFGASLAYGQLMTRGIVAPGARPLDRS